MGKRLKTFLNSAAPAGLDFVQRFFLTEDVAKAERRGALIGRLAYRFDKKHRNRAIANLELAYPDWTHEQRVELAKRMFDHFGLIMGDFLRTPLRSDEEVLASTEVEGFEIFDSVLARGNGIIACTGHVGNWERFAHWVSASGRHISVVARDANQSKIQDRVSAIRARSRANVISRGDSARELIRRLRNNEAVGILPDQNSEECFVKFFGKTCGSVLGPAVLHQRTGATLLPAFCVRLGAGKYRIIVKEPIDLDNAEKDGAVLMGQVQAAIESVIREYPEQWLWMHDRWKSSRLSGRLEP
jgi:KDO2-lipid IV(A) lauroyltransferase